ncbi:hypothetical protein ABE504_29350 [Paenibacillus oryzisoli]|uniref:XkdQ/YqbQ family protein n=1 Tax=Paenibacillus oryzisoli TaxID=1850517 RepID=UPI003D2DC6A2
MLTLEIDNRDGMMWEPPFAEVTVKTSRVGKASRLDFTLLKGGLYESDAFKYAPGNVVRLRYQGQPLFYGYIFVVDDGRDNGVKITAYDQVRYLMGNETYVFKNMTATEIIQKIADDLELKTGKLADTVHKFPQRLEDGTKLLDMICDALADTTVATGRSYVFYDDFGELALRDIDDWKLDFSIGDESLALDYKMQRSIDSDTYNRIKLVQDNKTTKSRDLYVAQDSGNIARWGRLQFYQKVNEKLNEAQIKQMLDNLIELKNRETRTFSIDAIGEIRVRAGSSVSINIGEIGQNSYFLVDECTHKFSGADHTMSLELRIYDYEKNSGTEQPH